ncbi:MAG: carbon-nitrogen hydrolase family protein [Bacillota bacterium]
MKRYPAACIQYEPVFGDKETNIDRLSRMIVRAVQRGARLCVLPELATTGYAMKNASSALPLAEPLTGPTFRAFHRVAEETGCTLLYGFLEREGHVLFNSCALVGPGGLAGHYRKTHLFPEEALWLSPGNLPIRTYETPSGRVCPLICMDADFFETARVGVIQGAEVLALLTNWVGPSPSKSWRARALENGVWVLASNRCGEEGGWRFTGGTSIIAPDGSVTASISEGDNIIVSELSAPPTPRYLDGRRPELYTEIGLRTYISSGLLRLPHGRVCTVRALCSPASGIEDALRRFEEGGERTDLVVLPVFPADGASVDWLKEKAAQIAVRFGSVLVAGLNHEETHVVAALPDGRIYQYSPVHPAPGERGGKEFVSFDTNFGRVGLLSGLDLYYPEAARCLAKRGVDIISMSLGALPVEHRYLVADRWASNNTYFVVADVRGEHAGIYGDPEAGKKHPARVFPTPGDEWVCASLNTAADWVRRKDYLTRTREELYYELLKEV